MAPTLGGGTQDTDFDKGFTKGIFTTNLRRRNGGCQGDPGPLMFFTGFLMFFHQFFLSVFSHFFFLTEVSDLIGFSCCNQRGEYTETHTKREPIPWAAGRRSQKHFLKTP